MKNFKAIRTTTAMAIVAGALCTALLAGCGNTTASSAGDSAAAAPAAEATSTASASDALLDTLAPAEDYANLEKFSATTIDGKTFTQDDLAKADVTVINFWATFCGFCKEEMPAIAEWSKTLPENVQVITICTDYNSDPKAAQEILDEAGFTGTTLVSGTGDFEKLLSTVQYLPTTMVVDSSGKIATGVLDQVAYDVPGTFGKMVEMATSAK